MSTDEQTNPGNTTNTEPKEEEYVVPSPTSAAGIRAMREADTKRPRVSVLSAPSPFNKPKLSKTVANWDTWLWDMEMHLGSAGFWDYIKDAITVPVPHAEYQPLASANFRANANAARYFLIANVDAKEAQQYNLLAETTPHGLRARLETIYAKPGPTLRLRLMEKCFQTFLVNDAKMIDGFDDLMDGALRSFKNMTVNTWQCLIGARAMGRDPSLAQAKETVIGAMAAAETAGQPDSFTPSHIREILLRHHSDSATVPVALAAQTQARPTVVCTNCKKERHTAQYCISPGGGMAGKTREESKEARKKDREASRNNGNRSANVATTTTAAPATANLADIVHVDSTTPDVPPELLAHAVHIPYEAFAVFTAPDTDALISSDSPSADHTVPFIADSGASVHVSPYRTDFTTYRPIVPRPIKGIGGNNVLATGIGDIVLHTSQTTNLTLKDALYVPNAGIRLVSMKALATDLQIVSHFDDEKCWFTDKRSGAVVGGGPVILTRNLYSITIYDRPVTPSVFATSGPPDLGTWHRRLAHANIQAIQAMARHGLIEGMPSKLSHLPEKCDSCILGKQTRSPVPKKRTEGDGHRATKRLEKVWVDLSGPQSVASRTGMLYIMNIIDDYSSFSWTIPLRNKSDAYTELITWEKKRELEVGHPVITYRTDNGELKSEQMKSWLESRGTTHETTAPYTSRLGYMFG
ncbi:hypothetical protein CVT24_002865 [Panaeolus cyanescens]|uniref:Integrase catalytic domain-containing protein n=1 Tax=Panaeolus cyanescens TaxID=181874 RepID=A0A409YRK6_9AGAR|nr:hypothetical protein CVT24_002865 [Panaeolus cyanescens]